MATKQEQMLKKQQLHLAKVMCLAAVLLFAGSTYLWIEKVYSNSDNVFWGMVDSNLKSFGRSTVMSQDDTARGLNQEQRTRLQLGAQNVAVSKTLLTQNAGNEGEIAITTESISTNDTNYVRYSDIKVASANQKDFGELTQVWAKDDNPTSGSSAFTQALFGSLGQVPVGNLTKSQRSEMIDYMKQQKVFELQRSHKEFRRGRPVMIYDASVAMDRYVGMLKKFDELMGLKQLDGVDPRQFANQQPINVNFIVDIASRNLNEFGYASNQQKEVYSAYGAFRRVGVPSETISLLELEQRLQASLFGQ